jgi:hypothetical protein
MRRRGLKQKVHALNDGTRTVSDIAREIGALPQYVSATLRRSGDKAKKGGKLPRLTTPAWQESSAHIEIRKRANLLGIEPHVIVGRLLNVAVEVGDLDVWFPLSDHDDTTSPA